MPDCEDRRPRTGRLQLFGVFCVLALFLAACGSSTDEIAYPPAPPSGTPVYKVGKPYQVAGVWYYPREDEGYDETGIASWYGPGFHGKRTANGEIFDENRVSAAHPTLPMPTLARVTNLENGKSIIVRVNDRGPFAHGRIIDLSRKSAELLGFLNQGTAKVRVEYLGAAPLRVGEATEIYESKPGLEVVPLAATPEKDRQIVAAPQGKVLAVPAGVAVAPAEVDKAIETPAAGAVDVSVAALAPLDTAVEQRSVPSRSNIYVQAGAFSSRANAEAMRRQLSGIGEVAVSSAWIDGMSLYRVRIGPMQNIGEADTSLEKLYARGHYDARIVVD